MKNAEHEPGAKNGQPEVGNPLLEPEPPLMRLPPLVQTALVLGPQAALGSLWLARSVSENLSVHPHGPLAFAGPLPFGFGPAPSARTLPPQLTPARLARRQIFRRLCVKQISCHSADTFSSPRNRNLRIPRADLIWPNTGSTMCLRAA